MIKQIQELGKISTKKLVLCTFLSIISGLSGFGFIALINEIVEDYISKNSSEISYYYGVSFILISVLFFLSRRILSGLIINLSQDIHWNVRTEVIKSVLNAPPNLIKKMHEEIYSTMTRDVGNVVNGSLVIIEFVSSVVLILFTFFYMAYLSYKVFLVSLLIIFLGVILYFFRMKKSNKKLNISRDLEEGFIGYFNNILYGIKEIKLNEMIGMKNISKIEHIATKAKENDTGAIIGYLNTQIITQMFFYILIMFILFNGITFFNLKVEIVISFVFVLLYIIGPISSVMSITPIMNNTFISINRILVLKKKLLDNNRKKNISSKENNLGLEFFKFIEYKNLQFVYPESDFSIGPINLIINKGDIIFIYGGNGNGKTTLLNTLLNLNNPKGGDFYLNGKKCNFRNESSFNELFSPIFSDFYLFDEFYGIDLLNINEANNYLKIFELEDKVSIVENKFSTIDLSSGQRKRLALINALLENKPILVLDEWAADQDPFFRKKFYTDIIPSLRIKGFTIIAITHDDSYYDCADRLFKMEYGNLIEENLLKFKY